MDKSSLIEARDEFLKLLPIIPIWLTILGACNLYTKYVVYDINIFSYLDLQEILMLFLDDLFYYLILSNGLLYLISASSDNDNPQLKINWEEKPKWIRFTFGLFSGLIPIFLLGYLTLITSIPSTLWKGILSLIASFVAVNLALNTCNKALLYIKERFDRPIYAVYRYYIFSFVLIAAWAYGRALINLSPEIGILTNKYLGSTILTSNKSINIDKFHILIGRTKNYTFIYTTQDNCTTIIPNSEIKLFDIKKKNLLL